MIVTGVYGTGSYADVVHVDLGESQAAVKIYSDEDSYHRTSNVIREVLTTINSPANLGEKIWVALDDSSQMSLKMRALGPTLHWLMKYRRHAMTHLNVLKSVWKPVVQQLVEVHKRGFMHRDIKPENILLDFEHQTTVLADYGIGGLADGADVDTYTLWYRPPEIHEGRMYSYSSDVYSLGLNLLWCQRGYRSVVSNKDYKAYKELQKFFGIPNQEKSSEYEAWVASTGYRDDTFAKLETRDDIVQFADLMCWCLEWDPDSRPSMQEVLEHPFFQKDPDPIDEHWTEWIQVCTKYPIVKTPIPETTYNRWVPFLSHESLDLGISEASNAWPARTCMNVVGPLIALADEANCIPIQVFHSFLILDALVESDPGFCASEATMWSVLPAILFVGSSIGGSRGRFQTKLWMSLIEWCLDEMPEHLVDDMNFVKPWTLFQRYLKIGCRLWPRFTPWMPLMTLEKMKVVFLNPNVYKNIEMLHR